MRSLHSLFHRSNKPIAVRKCRRAKLLKVYANKGKGTLLRLPRPAATVFIANPDVADVQVKTPSRSTPCAVPPQASRAAAVRDSVTTLVDIIATLASTVR